MPSGMTRAAVGVSLGAAATRTPVSDESVTHAPELRLLPDCHHQDLPVRTPEALDNCLGDPPGDIRPSRGPGDIPIASRRLRDADNPSSQLRESLDGHGGPALSTGRRECRWEVRVGCGPSDETSLVGKESLGNPLFASIGENLPGGFEYGQVARPPAGDFCHGRDGYSTTSAGSSAGVCQRRAKE